MAYKCASTTGAWSAAGTWDSVPNTPTIHASTNITISTTNLFTATFTAPNLVDAVNGCLLYIVAPGTAGHNITVTLQDNTVDTGATATLSYTNIKANSWVYFRFAAPYVFASLAAGRYRFKVVSSASGSHTGAADSGGANLAYLCTTDATGVPAATDYAFITSQNLGAAITVTMDGTQQIGNGADITFSTSGRSIGLAVNILYNGILKWDTAASATLTSLGTVAIFDGGELQRGTVATPYPAAFKATLTFNENAATNAPYGIGVLPGGKLTDQGVAKSSTSLWKTTYVSGTGVAASPFVVTDAVDWTVGDEIAVCAYSANATNYQETEYRFIITKNSPTSYVLSTTAGGAEAALTYTHTAGAQVLNVERNVLTNTTNTAQPCFVAILELTTYANIQCKWARYETIGASRVVASQGFMFSTGNTAGFVDYCVAYRPLYRGFGWNGSKAVATHTGLIVCRQNSASSTGAFDFPNNTGNKNFIDCYSIGNNRSGWYLLGASNCTWTRCHSIANNTAGSGVAAGWWMSAFNNCVTTDCEVHCNRIQGVEAASGSGSVHNNMLVGTKGTNAIDITCFTEGYVNTVFVNSNFGSATFVSNYLNMASGSRVKFQTLNDVTNEHRWYAPEGVGSSTGAGLPDTTVRTAGTLNQRFAAEDSIIGLQWEFLVLARPSTFVSIAGFIYDNAAFVADLAATATVDLYLPGSTSPDATQVMTNTTNANSSDAVFALAAFYGGTVPLYATVRITVKTATVAAYAYLADIFNGTNDITNLKTWYGGQPSSIMFEQLGDAAAVWAVLTSTLTTAGTTGKKLKDDLTLAQFIGLK